MVVDDLQTVALAAVFHLRKGVIFGIAVYNMPRGYNGYKWVLFGGL